MVFALRGAIQVGADEADEIMRASTRLVRAMCEKNALARDALVSVVFSMTEDLTSASPAAALRLDGFDSTPLFCVQEAHVDGGMPRVIRVLITASRRGRSRGHPVHVYLDGAAALRPDLTA
jgi:chorismate mutase